MFQRIIFILSIFAFHNSVSAEDNPESSLKQAKLNCEKKIREANREILRAKRNRNKEINLAIKEYSEALEKVKVHYTKGENLEKALLYKEQQEELLLKSISEFITSDPVKKDKREEFNPPETPKVIKKSEKKPIPVSFSDSEKKRPPVKKIPSEKVINLKDVQVTMTACKEPPEVNGEDIANFGKVVYQDKWWYGEENSACWPKGQTFIPKSNVYLKSFTYQMFSKKGVCLPTKSYTVRVCKVMDKKVTEIYKGTCKQDFTCNSDEYMTWSFDKKIPLSANTTYSIDVQMTASTTEWQTGIPNLNCTDDEYSEGKAYNLCPDTGELEFNKKYNDRVFHIDLYKD